MKAFKTAHLRISLMCKYLSSVALYNLIYTISAHIPPEWHLIFAQSIWPVRLVCNHLILFQEHNGDDDYLRQGSPILGVHNVHLLWCGPQKCG